MREFAALFFALDGQSRSSDKLAALERYFQSAPPADAAWALCLLSGGRGRRPLSGADLRRLAAAESGLALWLVEECYDTVGDLAETLALLLPDPQAGLEGSLAELIAARLEPLSHLPRAEREALLLDTWRRLDTRERLVFNKLLTGAFRVGVSAGLLRQALARLADLEPALIAQRLAGGFEPTAAAFEALLAPAGERDPARPYPLLLAHPLAGDPAELGPAEDFAAEWKWDGARAQLLRRGPEPALWSRGEELLSPGFPEVLAAAMALPLGTVLDGELLIWSGARPLPFARLQERLLRRRPSRGLLDRSPAVLLAYDLLEADGRDLRGEPFHARRAALEALAERFPPHGALRLAPLLPPGDWAERARLRAAARAAGAEGLMLKRRASPYGVGRVRGDWFKWKLAPYTADLVLVAAQKGHGRRADLYSDYTLAVWRGGELCTLTKAYSGLTEAELGEIDRFVRRHTTGRFGPVRTVEPALVFEVAFEGLQRSRRHKAGLALRFPRLERWRRDKGPADAERLETLEALLAGEASP
jgi:DNA ligase-1